jgi:hypothetical protein
MTKRNPLDPHDAFAKAMGARRVCATCAPHLRAQFAGKPSDHLRCNDQECGCRCQDAGRIN